MKKVTGDIIALRRGLMIHQVNAQGVMNGGVALPIRKAYPQVYKDYMQAVTQNSLIHGEDEGANLMGTVVWTIIDENLSIGSMFSQQFYGREPRRYTSYDALDSCLEAVSVVAHHTELPVHYPLIGCGLGGGYWPIVYAIIEKNFGTIDHTLWELPHG